MGITAAPSGPSSRIYGGLRGREQYAIDPLDDGVEYYSDNDLADIKGNICMEKALDRGDRGDECRVFVRKPHYTWGGGTGARAWPPMAS